DEELYPHMLTAIAGRRWVIGHGLRLAMMKCAESLEMRHAFADVVSAGVAKGLKDAPMDVIMASLYLESDTGGDAPQYIRDLRPSSSQLTIPVYPKGLPLLLVDGATQTDPEDSHL
nr:transposase (putative), gypsy type [Tanacetum cinerariifolium]